MAEEDFQSWVTIDDGLEVNCELSNEEFLDEASERKHLCLDRSELMETKTGDQLFSFKPLTMAKLQY